jgi:hypothetical protein
MRKTVAGSGLPEVVRVVMVLVPDSVWPGTKSVAVRKNPWLLAIPGPPEKVKETRSVIVLMLAEQDVKILSGLQPTEDMPSAGPVINRFRKVNPLSFRYSDEKKPLLSTVKLKTGGLVVRI